MFIFLVIFTSLLNAEDLSSERYCFAHPSEAQVARQKFQGLQVPSDQVTLEDNCLFIQMRPHRRELIQRYFLSTFPSTRITFSSAEIKRDPCQLKIEKEKIRSQDNLNINLSQNASLNHSTQTNKGLETFQIQTLKDFELSVDQSEVKGECRYINPNRYEISLEVNKLPRPIVPVELPPGSVVVLNEMPKDQETSSLKTVLQLNRGERIDIGSVISDLKKKSQSAELPPKIENETSSQILHEKVFLSLD